jgi:hypothetical protein
MNWNVKDIDFFDLGIFWVIIHSFTAFTVSVVDVFGLRHLHLWSCYLSFAYYICVWNYVISAIIEESIWESTMAGKPAFVMCNLCFSASQVKLLDDKQHGNLKAPYSLGEASNVDWNLVWTILGCSGHYRSDGIVGGGITNRSSEIDPNLAANSVFVWSSKHTVLPIDDKQTHTWLYTHSLVTLFETDQLLVAALKEKVSLV